MSATTKTLHIAKGVDLPLSVVTSKFAILAMTGMGKTYLARVMAEEMLKAGAQIIVADYLGVWWGLTSSASGKREGFNVVVFGGEHQDVPINQHSGKLIADLVAGERVNAVLDLSMIGDEDDKPKIQFLTDFARRLFHINKRPVHLFIDEADEWVPQQPYKYQLELLGLIKRIWQRGRVKGIGGSLISQRSALVNKSLLSQSEALIALRTVAPQDRDALAAWFESWGTKEQIEEFDKTISNLPDHHAWFWSPRHRLFVMSKARTAETFDSSSTPDIEAGILAEPTVRTKHDVARFGKEIEKLAEEAKENDPAKLAKDSKHYREQFEIAKQRINILEERLKKREKVKPVEVAKPVKVPMLSAKALAEVRRAERSIRKISEQARAAFADVEQATERIAGELGKAQALTSRAPGMVGGALRPGAAPAASGAVELPKGGHAIRAGEPDSWSKDFGKAAPSAPAGRGEASGNGGGGKLSGAPARILAALAQHGRSPAGKVRVLAGVKALRTFTTATWKLRTAGYIVGTDPIEITETGIDALGSYQPLPSGAALISYWKAQLGAGKKGEIFRVLLDRRQDELTHEEIMRLAHVNSDRTLGTCLWQLGRLGLVESKNKRAKLAPEFASI